MKKNTNRDDYLEHYIKTYRESVNLQEEGIKGKLTSILDKAIELSGNREEFFELLSFGNLLSQTKSAEPIEVILNAMLFEKRRMEANNYAASLLPSKEEVVVDPYKVFEDKETAKRLREEVEKLPEEEKKVIDCLCVNDDYITTIMKELEKSQEYVMTLQKSAVRHIALGLSLENSEDAKINRR